MKIKLPEHIGDITLSQFQRFENLKEQLENEEIDIYKYNEFVINLFTAIPIKDIKNVSHKDIKEISKQIEDALNNDDPFVNRFTMSGIEYGFITNFDHITTAEYVDLCKYSTDVETMHNLMAVLFRPITKKSFNTYEIETYKGTAEYADTMKQTPLNIVNGALSFFFHLSSELENSIQRYTQEELKRVEMQRVTLKSGDGTQL